VKYYPGLLLLLIFSCKTPGHVQRDRLQVNNFDKQGDLGVTTLEMDVVITKDKKVILSHEPWFGQEITTKPDGTYIREREERKFNINWMTYEDVKTFDVGTKPHPRFPRQQKMKVIKPVLSDIVDQVKNHIKTTGRTFPYFNIETKTNPEFDGVFHPGPEEFVELLVSVIKEKGIEEFVTIQSFDNRTLQYLHKKYPGFNTALLIEVDDDRSFETQLKDLGFLPTIYSPAFERVNQKLIRDCHKKNMKIIPWTVNTKEEIEKLRKWGVDGIISDYPDLFD
jgi:glycerophosphoryl diester phosphodiesterase